MAVGEGGTWAVSDVSRAASNPSMPQLQPHHAFCTDLLAHAHHHHAAPSEFESLFGTCSQKPCSSCWPKTFSSNLRRGQRVCRQVYPSLSRPTALALTTSTTTDLDSLCSAVLFAYFRSHTPSNNNLHIPLANIPHEDLPLRPELGAALAYAGVKSEDLLTLSELEEVTNSHGLEAQDTRWVLVDHNALTGTLAERFSSRVVGCVDHHEDENVVAADTGDEPRILKKAGSCMSLVVEYCKDVWDGLSSQSGTSTEDAEAVDSTKLNAGLARVALAPILLDTNNLKSKAKTTELDVQIAEYLEAKIREVDADFKRKVYYTELSHLKEDISRFSYHDNFRKDYKAWSEAGLVLGTSSIPQGFHYMLKHLGDEKTLLQELRRFSDEKKVDIMSIMTSSAKDDGVFKRNLLLWGLNEKGVQAVERFVASQGEALGLDTFQDGKLDHKQGSDEVRYCWYQHVTKNSRKQLAPMLRTAMREAAKL